MKETLKIFRDKLNNNEFVYGPFMKTSDPMFVEAVGLAALTMLYLIWSTDLLQLKISKTIFVRLRQEILFLL